MYSIQTNNTIESVNVTDSTHKLNCCQLIFTFEIDISLKWNDDERGYFYAFSVAQYNIEMQTHKNVE